ncbi:hypothetical protein EDD29_6840 [Actinocorallia herbida]|uniref:Uncharacterized protein n=1 Tax=Actinocorallia herbida TaxID=58109 RepID=A0A3N1D6J2_9ACTN|nr:hypothetical protein [Actinocorallia herbida]ROO89153.1 hypothetical protein EDD29_6840 [Actinocorallia herbida]
MVRVTEKGDAFPLVADCVGLVDHQARDLRRGNEIRTPRKTTQSSARFTPKRTPCQWCFPS